MRIVERYTKVRGIGAGTMGEVWEGRDERLNRDVAIKLIRGNGRPPDDEARRRFFREARVLGRVRHPGVPVLYDFGDDGPDDLFLVMELISGATLDDLIGEVQQVPVPWAAAIGAQLCAALAAAHAASLVHRDLKPANVLLGRNGTVKVADFGLAAASDGGAGLSAITWTGQTPGTALYMAPELAEGDPADARSDLYSVGCLLYELLAGERVFASGNTFREIGRHVAEPAPSVREIREEVPVVLDELLRELLAKDPGHRPANAVQVCARLLPLVKTLPPLPGFVDARTDDPARLYATAVAALG
ncbi:serine/threonine-protein kinase [Actinomadura sp. 9N407]|uniref:serine/threonine-protein kinase n=1 Tax=Actinomadura sp. 9N407 TaxID=3375154 RepID=UPI0037B14511